MTRINPGDRINIVLDLLPEERDGRLYQVVHFRGAFAPGATNIPPCPSGARRNVIQHWYAVPNDQTVVGAFAIDTGPVEEPS